MVVAEENVVAVHALYETTPDIHDRCEQLLGTKRVQEDFPSLVRDEPSRLA